MIDKTNPLADGPLPNGHRQPTLPRIQEALDLAAQDALELHRKHGLPLAVWQDGKISHVSAESVKQNIKPQKPT